MSNQPPSQKKPKRALSNLAKCPACEAMVDGTVEGLLMHFSETHKRRPTNGELFQFRSYKKKDFKPSGYTTGYVKSRLEVSGGLPSLGKRK